MPQWIQFKAYDEDAQWLPHCPSCGQASAELDDLEATVTPCQHLQFVYVSLANGFEYQSPAFMDAQQHHPDIDVEADFNLDDAQALLESLGYGDTLVVFEVLRRGGHFGGQHTDLFAFALSSSDT